MGRVEDGHRAFRQPERADRLDQRPGHRQNDDQTGIEAFLRDDGQQDQAQWRQHDGGGELEQQDPDDQGERDARAMAGAEPPSPGEAERAGERRRGQREADPTTETAGDAPGRKSEQAEDQLSTFAEFPILADDDEHLGQDPDSGEQDGELAACRT